MDGQVITKYLETMARTTATSEIVVGLTQYGVNNLWSSRPAALAPLPSRYQIGCIGKLLNSALILELCATGSLEIDLPISCYLPAFDNTPIGNEVLVRHLLCGTAGYLGHASVSLHDRGLTWDQLVEQIKSAPRIFRPGDVYSLDYSSYVLLGEIIESVCRRPWTEVVDDVVAVPLFGRRLYEKDSKTSVWLAAVFNIALSMDELMLLGRAAVHGTPRAGARRVFRDSTVRQLQGTVARVPVLAGQSGWLPRGYGFGMAEYHSGLRGTCGKGSGHLTSIRVLPARDITFAVCVDSRNAFVRHAVVDAIAAELGVVPQPNIESMPLPDDMSPEDLRGTYVGLRGFAVTVEFNRPTLCITMRSAGRPEIRVSGTIDDANFFSMPKRSPVVGVAFFRDPATGCPALMIGVSALRKQQ